MDFPTLFRRVRALVLPAVLLAVLALSVWVAKPLYLFYLGNERTPMWDMAGNGQGGVELLQALSEGRLLRFLQLLNAQDKWPFGYSLLLLPFLAAGGSTFASATLLGVVLFAITPPLLVWVAHEADPRGDQSTGIWGGLLAAGLFLASPLHRVLGIVVMRELAGVVFTLLALGFYLRARRVSTLWSWRLAGLSTLALFLIKYNYALIWGLCVAVDQFLSLPRERRMDMFRRLRRLLWPWPGASRGQAALAVALDLLLICAVVGVNPGVGVYALLLIGTGIAVVRWRRDPERVRSWSRSLPTAARALLETVVIPLWMWCLSPDPVHPKNIYAFLRNRSTGPPVLSLESFSYYARSLVTDYAPAVWIGVLVIAFGLLGMRRSRVLALLAGLGWLLATIHPYKEPRFFATTAPFFFLLAGIGLAWILARWRTAVAALVCSAAILGLASMAQADKRLVKDYLLYSADPRYGEALEFLQRKAAGRGRVALIGTYNEFSDNLVRWSMAQSGKIHLVPSLHRPKAGEVPRRLKEWLEEEKPRRILAIRLLPRSPLFQGADFQRYNAWQFEALRILQADPAWGVTRRKRFRQLNLELVVLDRRTASGQLPSDPE
ncbi:MAG TPA: hypothetical protein VN493_05810 [Thermoanaerobaculia bacterium]|nr:hypothetical protein [Thermoanaerobaculia bacterium]